MFRLEYNLAFGSQYATGIAHLSSIRQMVMENTWHEMDTYALGNVTSSLGKNDIPTGTVVLGKVILTDAAGPERESQYIDTHVNTARRGLASTRSREWVPTGN